ncbi:MAG: hypothetical protein WBB25_11325 [Sulfitobacter sp.]
MSRQNFSPAMRGEVFRWNAIAVIGRIDGVNIDEQQQDARKQGLIYYCENCKFCHTDRMYFDVDHLVPDVQFRGTGRPSNSPINAVVLCKSYESGARGCNQTKGGRNWPPPGAGLAITRKELDMNWTPIHLRDANSVWP